MSVHYLNKSLSNNGLLIPKNKRELHGSWRGIIYLYYFNTDRFVYSLQHLGKTKIFRFIIKNKTCFETEKNRFQH